MDDTLYVLGIDLEGISEDLTDAGPNLKVDRVIEVGAVLWDCRYKIPVSIISEIINETDRIPITNDVYELTGLNDELVDRWGKKGDEIRIVLEQLAVLIQKANYLMAHNAKVYDKPMLTELFRRFRVPMPEKVWIDTLTDIEFPKKMVTKSLAGLEHSHGFINPFPHRALTDVLSMLKIASQYSVPRMAKLAESPLITIIAQLHPPNWKNSAEVEQFNRTKNKVSKARFRWNPSEKNWSKQIQKVLIDEGKIDYEFPWYIAGVL